MDEYYNYKISDEMIDKILKTMDEIFDKFELGKCQDTFYDAERKCDGKNEHF